MQKLENAEKIFEGFGGNSGIVPEKAKGQKHCRVYSGEVGEAMEVIVYLIIYLMLL